MTNSDPSPPPIVFGDDDPEDAYDVGDPIEQRAALIGRVLVSIIAERLAQGDTERVLARIVVAERIFGRIVEELYD